MFRMKMSIRGKVKKLLSKSSIINTTLRTLDFELKHRQDFSKLDDKEKELLLEIKKNGYVIIPDFFDKEFCHACIKDTDWMLENKKELVHKTTDLRIFGAEDLSENIMKFSAHELFYKLANAYNTKPTYCGFTLTNKVEATGAKYGSGGGGWHRDSYFRQFKSLLYLNDVNEDNGPFQVIHNSHDLKQRTKDTKSGNLDSLQVGFEQEVVDNILRDDPDRLHTLTGKAGTVILVDTSIIHRGIPIKKGVRYALTNYFFEKTLLNSHLVEHFSPLVSPQKVLKMGQN